MSLILRREERDQTKILKRYVHLATGNYHSAHRAALHRPSA